MRLGLPSVVAAVVLGFGAQASATTLFSDNFQTNLNQWTQTSGGAAIVAAPGGGNALSFSIPWSAGDLFSKNGFSSGGGSFTVSFDVLGACRQASDCGAFLGAPGASSSSGDGWLVADTTYAANPVFPDTGKWEHVTYTFGNGAISSLMLEDFSGSANSGNDVVFFRNLVLTDNPGGAAIGTFTVSSGVPEPAAWSLLLLGVGAVGAQLRAARRTVRASAA